MRARRWRGKGLLLSSRGGAAPGVSLEQHAEGITKACSGVLPRKTGGMKHNDEKIPMAPSVAEGNTGWHSANRTPLHIMNKCLIFLGNSPGIGRNLKEKSRAHRRILDLIKRKGNAKPEPSLSTELAIKKTQ